MTRGKDIGSNMRRLTINSLLPTDTIYFNLKKDGEIPKILLGKKLNIHVSKNMVDYSGSKMPDGIKIWDFEDDTPSPNFNVSISRHSGFKNGLDIKLDVA